MAVAQPYAKLHSEDFVYYMWTPSATLGRSSTNDITLSHDKSISHNHATISFSPIRQRFELHIHGRNGLHLNNKYYPPGFAPLPLTSHSEIIVGKRNPTLFIFVLPISPTIFEKDVHEENPTRCLEPFVEKVGKLIVSSEEGRMSIDELIHKFCEKYRALALQIGINENLRNCIRHSIQMFPELFKVWRKGELQTERREVLVEVRREHVHVFVEKIIEARERKERQGNGGRGNSRPEDDVVMVID